MHWTLQIAWWLRSERLAHRSETFGPIDARRRAYHSMKYNLYIYIFIDHNDHQIIIDTFCIFRNSEDFGDKWS